MSITCIGSICTVSYGLPVLYDRHYYRGRDIFVEFELLCATINGHVYGVHTHDYVFHVHAFAVREHYDVDVVVVDHLIPPHCCSFYLLFSFADDDDHDGDDDDDCRCVDIYRYH
uniref:ZP domain-containing protein n=1 Tax=Ascaris lumbricoides TaxID=6252 RepID=A0A0M3IXU8_ASCLU